MQRRKFRDVFTSRQCDIICECSILYFILALHDESQHARNIIICHEMEVQMNIANSEKYDISIRKNILVAINNSNPVFNYFFIQT